MFLSYVYKLRPDAEQFNKMDAWLDMLRASYNYNFRDRLDAYNSRFAQGNYCDLATKAEVCPLVCLVGGATGYPWKISGLAKVKKQQEAKIFGDYCQLDDRKVIKAAQIKPAKRNAGEIQMAELPLLKISRPWYAHIDSTVLQENIKRLDKAYQNFFDGRGFPKFKNRSTFRSFTYTLGVNIDGNKIYLPKIGWMRFYNSRPIPDGFKVKSCTLRRKSDGWYISVRIEDPTVPTFPTMKPEDANTAVGGDMGIRKLITWSDGSKVKNPKLSTNKKTKRLLRIRQREISRKKKGSKNRRKAANRLARLHQKITNKRTALQWKIAVEICKKFDAIFLEDLKVSNMKKRCKPKKDDSGRYVNNGQSKKAGLNRAISDASWFELRLKIQYQAAKSGKIFEVVPPQYTSQECPECHHIDADNREGETFLCTECGFFSDADWVGGVSVKQRGVQQTGIALKCRVSPGKSVRVDYPEPKQLTLFSTPTPESTGGKRSNAGSRRNTRKCQQPGNPPIQLSLDLWDMCGFG